MTTKTIPPIQLAAQRESIEEALLGYFRQTSQADAKRELQKALTSLVATLDDNDEPVLGLAVHALSQVQAGRPLEWRDVADLIAALRSLTAALYATEFPASAVAGRPSKSAQAGRRVKAVRALFDRDVSPQLDRKGWIAQTKKLIYQKPGLYLTQLQTQLSARTGRDLSYPALRSYVDELVEAEEVLTIGGPQGRLRFCFPDPNAIKDFTKYRGKQVGVDARVQREVTENFEDLSVGNFKSVYLVNSSAPAMLLVVPRLVRLPKSLEIRAFGQFFSPSQERELGLKLVKPSSRLPDRAIRAVQVASVGTEGKEQDLWTDRELLKRLPAALEET